MRIAVFLPNWVGDVVMATPAINALWEGLLGSSLIAVGRPYVRGVIDGAPWFEEFVAADRNQWMAAARKLRRRGCDIAVLFPNSFRSALTARLAGATRRIGYARYGRRVLLTDALEPERDEAGKIAVRPVLDSYNRIVARLGVQPSQRMRLFTTPDDEQAADNLWSQFELSRYPEVIALNPGAAFGAAKHWPTEYFAELARNLVDQRGAGVLVLCGPAERELARQIVAISARPSVYSLADCELSLGLTKAFVRRADLLVTTDSGPRHFAAAFGRPVVTLFGPTHIKWTETYFPAAIHLQKKVDCGPCQLRTCPLDHRCMKNLTPDEVLAASERLLAGFQEARHAG
ncbi:MAG: lipopolysaccharide heptosyltransferase II [Gemmataceae bacterium]